MMIGRLDIQTIPAKIDFSSTPARLDMRQPLPQLSITRETGSRDIETTNPQLSIDSSACRADEGYKTSSEFTEEFAQEGMQALYDAASKFTQEGEFILENFHTSENVIADLAKSKTSPQMSRFELKFIPSHQAEINCTPGSLRINFSPDKIKLNWNVSPQADIHVAQEAQFNLNTVQYPEIKFNYIQPQLDITA